MHLVMSGNVHILRLRVRGRKCQKPEVVKIKRCGGCRTRVWELIAVEPEPSFGVSSRRAGAHPTSTFTYVRHAWEADCELVQATTPWGILISASSTVSCRNHPQLLLSLVKVRRGLYKSNIPFSYP